MSQSIQFPSDGSAGIPKICLDRMESNFKKGAKNGSEVFGLPFAANPTHVISTFNFQDRSVEKIVPKHKKWEHQGEYLDRVKSRFTITPIEIEEGGTTRKVLCLAHKLQAETTKAVLEYTLNKRHVFVKGALQRKREELQAKLLDHKNDVDRYDAQHQKSLDQLEKTKQEAQEYLSIFADPQKELKQTEKELAKLRKKRDKLEAKETLSDKESQQLEVTKDLIDALERKEGPLHSHLEDLKLTPPTYYPPKEPSTLKERLEIRELESEMEQIDRIRKGVLATEKEQSARLDEKNDSAALSTVKVARNLQRRAVAVDYWAKRVLLNQSADEAFSDLPKARVAGLLPEKPMFKGRLDDPEVIRAIGGRVETQTPASFVPGDSGFGSREEATGACLTKGTSAAAKVSNVRTDTRQAEISDHSDIDDDDYVFVNPNK